MIGRKGRLVNHSCEPNCKVEIRTVDNERVVLVAKQKIGIGVEITFNTISYSSTEYQTMLILCIYLFCGMSITVHSTKITKAHIIYGAKIILCGKAHLFTTKGNHEMMKQMDISAGLTSSFRKAGMEQYKQGVHSCCQIINGSCYSWEVYSSRNGVLTKCED